MKVSGVEPLTRMKNCERRTYDWLGIEVSIHDCNIKEIWAYRGVDHGTPLDDSSRARRRCCSINHRQFISDHPSVIVDGANVDICKGPIGLLRTPVVRYFTKVVPPPIWWQIKGGVQVWRCWWTGTSTHSRKIRLDEHAVNFTIWLMVYELPAHSELQHQLAQTLHPVRGVGQRLKRRNQLTRRHARPSSASASAFRSWSRISAAAALAWAYCSSSPSGSSWFAVAAFGFLKSRL